MKTSFEVGDIVITTDYEDFEDLVAEGAATAIMKVMETQGETVLVKFLNESGTYSYGTINQSDLTLAV